MTWVIRYLAYPPAKRLLRECAADTLSAFGSDARRHLRHQIDAGTPASGRFLIWLMMREVRREERRAKRREMQG